MPATATAIQHRVARLPNGLEIQAEIDATAHTAAAGFFVRTGSRDEPGELMGVSHFLEHMMFKGSERRTAEDVNRAFDDLGASQNAFTTNELTAYHAHVLPERLHSAVEILSDILRPALREQDFREEKGVILEEIAMYADQPFWVGYEALIEQLYADHPLSHRVLGTTNTVGALTRDQMHRYFSERYSSDNTVLVAAGRLDFDALVREAERLCSGWTSAKPARVRPSWSPGRAHATIGLKNTTRAYLLLSMPAPAIQDDERYSAGILMHILGGGDGSRLHWALVETGLAEEASAAYDGHDGAGDSTIFAVCDADKTEEIEAALRKELAKLIASLDEDDLLRARSKIATSAAVASERPAGRMMRLGTLWGYSADYTPLEEEVARISRISLDDLRGVAERYPLEPTVRIAVVPEDHAEAQTPA